MNIEQMLAGASNDRATGGAIGMRQLDELQKALESGYGTDIATLTGGAALRIQSLDKTMKATIVQNKHLKLFNTLEKNKATATVDEWTEQHSIGGFLGGTTNTETGDIRLATGDAERKVGLVKYLMTRAEVSVVMSIANNIVDAEAFEQSNAAKRLLSDAEYLSFEGDSDVVATEFDGIYKQMVDLNLSDHIRDMRGGSLSNIREVLEGAALIAGYGNFGQATHLYVSNLTQTDMDASLDPAYRVPLTNVAEGGLKYGVPVVGIRTSFGTFQVEHDVFIRDEAQMRPFELAHASIAAANAFVPAAVAGVPGADAASKFEAAHAGNYYYAVAGITGDGQSVVAKSAQVVVAAGEKVTLTIDKSVAGTETGYVIYRSRKNGTNATADFREVKRIAYSGGATTVWVDLNEDIPGTSKAYLLNLSAADQAITWRQFLPMMKFPLATTTKAVIPWAQLLFGYLRMAKRRHNVIIKNILPQGAVWRPFE